MPRPTRVAIDLRPLARGPSTGIGLIVSQLLEELPSHGFEFLGLTDRPVESALPRGTQVQVLGRAGGRMRWESRVLPGALRALDPRPDLYHATWNHGVPAALPFPSVLSLHDLIPWIHPELVPWPRPAFLHQWLYRRAVARSAQNAKVVVTLSEASRADLSRILPGVTSKLDVVPCAVPRWLTPSTPEARDSWRARFGGRYWLYLGGFDPRKGIDVLAEGVAQAARSTSKPPALVLAGAPNALAERAAAAVRASGVQVYLPGYVPDEELSALLGGAALFIYPSRYEGFGIPPLLAMALGTPCVTSDTPAVREVVGDAALLYPADSPDALAKYLRMAASDPGAVEARTRGGPERAQRFSLAEMVARMRRVYERAASLPPESA